MPEDPRNPLLRSAIAYATRLKWRVFPLKARGKDPLTPHGYKDATLDEQLIREWWKKWPKANIGIPTGEHFFVFDKDPRAGGDDSVMTLVHQHGPLADTLCQATGGGGQHRLYLPPEGRRIPNVTGLYPGIDIKGDGGYIVVAPSIHPNGTPYFWDTPTSIFDDPLRLADPWLVMAIWEWAAERNGRQAALTLPRRIPKGKQHMTLFRWGCWMRRKGAEEDELFDALWSIAQHRCEEPGPEADIRKLAHSIAKQFPAGNAAEKASNEPIPHREIPIPTVGNPKNPASNNQDPDPPAPRAEPIELHELHEIFSRWLYLPDIGIVTVTLAAVAANRIAGDPVWPLLVGPPSSGKTEILDSLLSLPDMHSAGALTEAALLSGSPRREKARDANGGLLRAMGEFGFILIKDFTSVLSMARESRGPLLAALREIYDGAWTRRLGTDGGRTIEWRGKAVLIGASTPVIDQHHAVMASMGERFIFCRFGEVDPSRQAEHALRHVGRESVMRRELREAVKRLFLGFTPAAFSLEQPAYARLSALASLVARCRSAVERDNYRKEVELIPDSELPARITISLARLFHGMEMLGVPYAERWRLITKVALDCVPDLRRRILLGLLPLSQSTSTKNVALIVRYPTNTARRSLEDLAAHGIITRQTRGRGTPDEWELSLFSSKLVAVSGLADVSGKPVLTASAGAGLPDV